MIDKKVLIVEDEVDIREAMEDALIDSGMHVITAENGEVGLQKAKAEQPDLILLDIVMPIMDGHEMLKKLREDAWGKGVKVIALTSMDDVENIWNAHDAGIDDYIIKANASLEDIVNKVRLVVFSS